MRQCWVCRAIHVRNELRDEYEEVEFDDYGFADYGFEKWMIIALTVTMMIAFTKLVRKCFPYANYIINAPFERNLFHCHRNCLYRKSTRELVWSARSLVDLQRAVMQAKVQSGVTGSHEAGEHFRQDSDFAAGGRRNPKAQYIDLCKKYR